MAKKATTETGTEAPTRHVPSVMVRHRIAHPFGSPVLAIPLKRQDLMVHVVDAQLRSGRVHEMRQKGWEFVTAADLIGVPEDFGYTCENDRICRGERGREVLMKMAKADYDAIAQAKAASNAASLRGSRGRDAVAHEVAAKVGAGGDEAAEWVHQRLTITDTKESVTIEE